MGAPVTNGDELELRIDSLAYGGNGVARLDGFVVFVQPRPAGRSRPRPRDQGEAQPRRGGGARGGRAGRAAGRRAVPAFPHVRRLPLPGSRLRGAARGQGEPGRRCARPDRRDARSRARARHPRGVDLPLPQQAGVLVHVHAGRRRARLPPGRAAGTRCSTSRVLAHDRPRQRDPRRRARRGRAPRGCSLRPGDAARLPAPPRRPRGAQHGPGARAARHRAGRARVARAVRLDAAPVPGGELDPLGRERPAGRGHEPADRAALGRGGDRGGAPRAPLPRAAERVPPDEHGDGRAAVRPGARVRRADGRARPSTTSTAASARSACRSPRTR